MLTHDTSDAPRPLCPACGFELRDNYCARCQRTLSFTALAAEEAERQRRAAQTWRDPSSTESTAL